MSSFRTDRIDVYRRVDTGSKNELNETVFQDTLVYSDIHCNIQPVERENDGVREDKQGTTDKSLHYIYVDLKYKIYSRDDIVIKKYDDDSMIGERIAVEDVNTHGKLLKHRRITVRRGKFHGG